MELDAVSRALICFHFIKIRSLISAIQRFIFTSIKNSSNKTVHGAKPGEYLPLLWSSSGSENPPVDPNVYPGCIKYADIWTRSGSEQFSYKDIIVYRLAETYDYGG